MASRFGLMPASLRTRLTVGAALVITACLTIAGALLLLVLYQSLHLGAQSAASARAEQISTQLRTESPREIDPSLLVTDSQVGVVQIIDTSAPWSPPPTGRPGRHWRRCRCQLARPTRWAGLKTPAGDSTTGSRREGPTHPMDL